MLVCVRIKKASVFSKIISSPEEIHHSKMAFPSAVTVGSQLQKKTLKCYLAYSFFQTSLKGL